MELREAESLSMLYHHHRSVGNIDPHFNHGRGDKDMNPSFLHLHHDGLFLVTFHPAMEQANPKCWKDFFLKVLGHLCSILEIQFLRFLYEGIDHESLATLFHL